MAGIGGLARWTVNEDQYSAMFRNRFQVIRALWLRLRRTFSHNPASSNLNLPDKHKLSGIRPPISGPIFKAAILDDFGKRGYFVVKLLHLFPPYSAWVPPAMASMDCLRRAMDKAGRHIHY
jgi:hypothetical protein